MLDYIERRLRSDERDAVEQHAAVCTTCRQVIAELARTTVFDRPPSSPGEDPKRIARYRIESRLGSGGMGTVYVAHDPELDRRVALKLVHPDLARIDAVERLLCEGRVLARLEHPNIVGVHDAGTDEMGRVYIAMELVDGDTLTTWLEREPRRWREVVRMFVAIARGLAAAHGAGVVHRDVKPDNVLVARNNEPKVVDFGLASRLPERGAPPFDPIDRITRDGAVLGTPAFMSPEQWNGSDVGPATDQYSLCAALREALGTCARPAWLDRAIARGTARDPHDRFPSMAALGDALDADRRARRSRRVAVVAAPILMTSIASVALARGEPAHALEEPCRAAATERAALWTPIDQMIARSSIYATGVPWAGQLWARADRNMTSYLKIVARAEAETCAAAPRTAEAIDTAKLTLRCLADARFAALGVSQRLQTVTPRDARGGLRGWFGMPEPQECTNAAYVKNRRAVDSKAATAALGDRMQRALDAAEAADERGDHEEAIALARQAVEHATQLGDPYVARALLELGDRLRDVDAAAAERAYRDALAATDRAKLDVMRVDAMIQLMKALAEQPGREREIFDLAPLLTAAAARANKQSKAAPHVHRLLGVAHDRLGNHAEAIDHLQQALALARARHKNQFDTRLIKYLMTLAEALQHAKRDVDAKPLIDEALRLSEAVKGTDNSETQRLIAARNQAD